MLAIRLCTLALMLSTVACRAAVDRRAPPTESIDAPVAVDVARTEVRDGAPGAPVECRIGVDNRSDQTLTSLTVACELVDATGASLGVGLGAVENLAPGRTRTVRTVVYGVRSFETARAIVTSAVYQ